MSKLKRTYSKTDAEMLEISTTHHRLLEDNIADFTAFDPNFNALFLVEWQQAIQNAYNFETAHLHLKILSQKTETLQAHIQLCRDKYNEVKFFAHKAFGKNKALMQMFGTETYRNIKTDKDALVSFMAQLYQSCMDYQSQLLAVGLSQNSIDDIKVLKNKLLELTSEQRQYKKTKRSYTEERIKCLNQCYAFNRLVIDAAFVIYKNDYARKKMFLFKIK